MRHFVGLKRPVWMLIKSVLENCFVNAEVIKFLRCVAFGVLVAQLCGFYDERTIG
jgi:hypothetical protein